MFEDGGANGGSGGDRDRRPSLSSGGDTPASFDCRAALESLGQVTAVVAGVDLDRLGDDDLRELVLLQRERMAALDHAGLRLLAALDARPGAVPGSSAGRAAATFLIEALNTSPAVAHRDVAAARLLHPTHPGPTAGGVDFLPHMPDLSRSYEHGEITREHVDVVTSVLRRIPRRLLAAVDDAGASNVSRVDALMTELSHQVPPRTVEAAAKQLLGTLAPDRADRFDPQADLRRELRFTTDSTGMLVGRFQLDPVAGLAVRAAVEAFAATPTVQASDGAAPGATASARSATGQDEVDDRGLHTVEADRAAGSVPDRRSRAQRQADALAAMARAALSVGPHVAGAVPRIVIHATVDQVRAAAEATPPAEYARRPSPTGDDSSGAPSNTAPSSSAPSRSAPSASAPSRSAPSGSAPSGSAPSAGVSADGHAGRGDSLEDGPHRADSFVCRATPNRAAPDGSALEGAAPDRSAPGWARGPGGEPISPRTLGTLVCDALLSRVLLAPNGAVLDLGRAVRTATAAQRTALSVRDQGCVAPGCTVPESGCEAHHTTWWSRGGATDVSSMALLCPRHHANVHQGHWQIQMVDGLPWVRAPRWLDPRRRWRRNDAHAVAARAIQLGQQLARASSLEGRPPEDPRPHPADPLSEDAPPNSDDLGP